MRMVFRAACAVLALALTLGASRSVGPLSQPFGGPPRKEAWKELAQVGQIPWMLAAGGGTAAWAVGSTITAARSLAVTDATHVLPVNCLLDFCQITLPASTFAAGTQIVLQNTSGATVVPIALVSSAYSGQNCSTSCNAVNLAFSVTNLHDGIIIEANTCNVGCNAAAPSVSSITDTAGNVANCALVKAQNSAAAGFRDEQWVCPNTAVTGADTWTVHLSGTGQYAQFVISEWSGLALASPAEVANGATAAASSQFSVTTSARPTQRNDLIYCSIYAPGGTNPTTQQTLTASNYNGDGYWLSSGGSGEFQSCTWGSGSNPSAQTIAAYKAASPLSIVDIVPAGGVTIYGIPVNAGGDAWLVPGASILLTVDANGNYEAQYSPPIQGQGVVDEVTDTGSVALVSPRDCYITKEFTSWSTQQTISVPFLPPNCSVPILQGGSVAPKIIAGAGVQLKTLVAGQTMNGQNSGVTVTCGGGGNVCWLKGELTTP